MRVQLYILRSCYLKGIRLTIMEYMVQKHNSEHKEIEIEDSKRSAAEGGEANRVEAKV